MSAMQIRTELDKLIDQTASFDETVLPAAIINNLKNWRWGSYGWISPASLLFTATWRKYYYPSVDCCKIWANDEYGKPIPGGYSIRSEDESISIPLLAKYDLCDGFCSPNSGMQGSRAIEKMRSLKRLNKDFDSAQRTVFDLKLFAAILNQINELDQKQLLELLKCFIIIAKRIRTKRLEVNARLRQNTSIKFDLLRHLSNTQDPEFTKCVVAACLTVLYRAAGAVITGVGDHKTAADARANKPGDLTLEKDGIFLVAIEVKDNTQHIDWNNIERAKRILQAHPELKGFLFVLESSDAVYNTLVSEIVKSPQLATKDGKLISIISLHVLYQMAVVISTTAEIIDFTGTYLSLAPGVKQETKDTWLKMMK